MFRLMITVAVITQVTSSLNACKNCDSIYVDPGSPEIAKQMLTSAFSVSQSCETGDMIDCSENCIQTTRTIRLEWVDASHADAVGELRAVQCGRIQPTCDIWSNPDLGVYPDINSLPGITIHLDNCEDVVNNDIPRKSLGLPEVEPEEEPEEEKDPETDDTGNDTTDEIPYCNFCSDVFLTLDDGSKVKQNRDDGSSSCDSPSKASCSTGLECGTVTLIYSAGGENNKLITKGCFAPNTTCGHYESEHREKPSDSDVEFHDCDILFTKSVEKDTSKNADNNSNYTVDEENESDSEEVSDGSNSATTNHSRTRSSLLILGFIFSNIRHWY